MWSRQLDGGVARLTGLEGYLEARFISENPSFLVEGVCKYFTAQG